MVIKPYERSALLQLRRSISIRTDIVHAEQKQYENLEKGHEGERQFADSLDNLSSPWLILHDVMLEHRGSIFQIDALLVSQRKIYLFEVKNYRGDFYIDSGKWYTHGGKEIQNPVHQLSRCETLLRQLLQEQRVNLPIESRIIFIHPEFILYQAPKNLPLVFPSQINRLLEELNLHTPYPSEKLITLAKKLADHHITDSPFSRLPEYTYDGLKKGIICTACHSLKTFLARKTRVECEACGQQENADEAILRSIKELRTLFPNTRLTTTLVVDWTRLINARRKIMRLLSQNFTAKGYGRHLYYIDSEVTEL